MIRAARRRSSWFARGGTLGTKGFSVSHPESLSFCLRTPVWAALPRPIRLAAGAGRSGADGWGSGADGWGFGADWWSSEADGWGSEAVIGRC